MKLWQVIILAVLVLAAVWGCYHAVTAYGAQRDKDGYDRRVGEESKAFADAEAKAQKDQQAADAGTIAGLRQALADANEAVSDRDDDLADMNSANTTLQKELNDARKQSPDASRWLAEPIPGAVLCRLQPASACPSPATGSPGH